jgi:multidrug efflux pump subunit AcrA (membrane-fusion protein)
MRHYRKSMASIAKLLCVTVMILAFILPNELSGQAPSSNFVAPGRVEGTGPTLSIGTAASGTVREVLVHEGSRVRAGEPLVTLDCRPIEAEVHARTEVLRTRFTRCEPFDQACRERYSIPSPAPVWRRLRCWPR